MKREIIEKLSQAVIHLLRKVVSLSDASFAKLLDFVEKGVQGLSEDEEALRPIRELKEIAREDKEGMRVLRTLILRARTAQLVSIVSGMLQHYLLSQVSAPSRVKKPRRKSRLTIGCYGRSESFELLRQAYKAAGCQVHSFESLQSLVAEAKQARLSAIECVADRSLTHARAEYLLSLGTPLSLHFSKTTPYPIVQQIVQHTFAHRIPFRFFYPYFYYPPLQKAKELLTSDVLGEVSMVRIRATLGGKGGQLKPELLGKAPYRDHPAFDHYLLLAFFGGSIAQATAYLHPPQQQHGGQGLINCKFFHPGRYGLLECSFAPSLTLTSAFFPYDLSVEIAGTNGLLWVNRGMADRVQEPPLYVRVGKKEYAFGTGTALEKKWGVVYESAAQSWLEVHRREARPILAQRAMLSALRLKANIYAIARSPQISKL